MYKRQGQSEEEMEITFKLGKKYSDIFRLALYTPLAGSLLYYELKKQGKLLTEDPSKYSYEYYVIDDGRDACRIQKKYFSILRRYYLSLGTILSAFYSKNPLKSRMIRRTYKAAFYYLFYKSLRKVGVKLL